MGQVVSLPISEDRWQNMLRRASWRKHCPGAFDDNGKIKSGGILLCMRTLTWDQWTGEALRARANKGK